MALSSRIATRPAALHAAAPMRMAARPHPRTSVQVRAAIINETIKKDVEKVVDMMKAEDIKGKAVFCRCWKSGTFPMCNGAHVKHNKETGDNVGPLIVSAAAPAAAPAV